MTLRATPVRRATRPLLLLCLTALAAALVGCTVSDPDGDGATIVQPGASAPADGGQAPAGDAPGTRGNPVPAGTVVKIGDWEVKLGPTNTNAADVIAAENQFNQAAPEGRQFVMVPVDVAYKGTESGTPWIDLQIKFTGSGGNTYDASDQQAYCGVIPNPLNNLGEMFPDATGTGNVCLAIPADQIQGGAWLVEELIALDTSRTFFALA